MAVLRERPYGQFNFLVNLGDGTTEGPEAGFQECSPITTSLAVVEYRNGNEMENSPRKLTGLEKVDDVTLRSRHHRLAGPLPLDRPVRNGDVAGIARSRSAFRTRTTPLS